jgi:hypothetical protein
MTTVQGSFAEAPPLPFTPYTPGNPDEINLMLAGRFARPNRRRYHYPSLPTAIVCLLATTCSLLATSRDGEKTLASWVPPVKQTVEHARTAMLGNGDRGEISFNGGNFR